MKRKLKLTPFAKIFIVVLIILGARYIYLNQENIKLDELNSFEEIKEKTENLFKKKIVDTAPKKKDFIINKTDTAVIKPDTITIRISDSNELIKIKTTGITINILKNKDQNTSDTLLFNISEEKALVGKIIYNKNK